MHPLWQHKIFSQKPVTYTDSSAALVYTPVVLLSQARQDARQEGREEGDGVGTEGTAELSGTQQAAGVDQGVELTL